MSAQLIKVSFPNKEGLVLAGRLHMPAGQVRAFAVYAHCFTCSKDIKAARNICQALSERGIAALRFDFAGLGESEGDFVETNFTSNVNDLMAAAAFLTENYQAPELMIGHSLGGTAALVAASRLPSIKAVSTVNSPAHPKHVASHMAGAEEQIMWHGEAEVEVSGRMLTIKQHFLDDLKSYDMNQVFMDMQAAVLVFHAPHDTTVNIQNASAIFSLAKHPKSFISLDSADHLIMNNEDAKYIASSIVAWASRYIQFDCQEDETPGPQHDGVVVMETDEGLYTQRVYARRHILRADEPTAVPGGLDLGPVPYDFVMSGLGACTSMTLRMYADHKQIPLDKITVHLSHQKDEAGRDHIQREIALEGALDQDQRQRLLEIAEKCPVHKTLTQGVEIKSRLSR